MTLDIIPTEEQEQLALVQWLELHKIRYTHVPNEGKHKVQYRAKQKRLGVKPGVPDILIFDRPPLYPENVGVAIELKRQKGGRVTPEQTAWLEHLKARGWAVAVCRGAMEAIRFLQELGFGGWSRCSS
jgi:hypothetical protein